MIYTRKKVPVAHTGQNVSLTDTYEEIKIRGDKPRYSNRVSWQNPDSPEVTVKRQRGRTVTQRGAGACSPCSGSGSPSLLWGLFWASVSCFEKWGQCENASLKFLVRPKQVSTQQNSGMCVCNSS